MRIDRRADAEQWRDFISGLVWECIDVPPEELEVAVRGRSVCLCFDCLQQELDLHGHQWMDGWIMFYQLVLFLRNFLKWQMAGDIHQLFTILNVWNLITLVIIFHLLLSLVELV